MDPRVASVCHSQRSLFGLAMLEAEVEAETAVQVHDQRYVPEAAIRDS